MLITYISIMIRTSCLVAVYCFLHVFKDVEQVNTQKQGHTSDSDFLAITVATKANDGYNRFMESAQLYNIPVKVFGMNDEWKGGNIAETVGGGQKVKILQEALKPYKDRENLILLFTDCYDVVFLNSSDRIMKLFKSSDVNVLFSAEGFCWPDRSLESSYPEVSLNEKRFLNSGGFIGYASYIYKIVTYKDIKDDDDDQLFYTNVFLKERNNWKIGLDTKSQIFQNLNGAFGELTIQYTKDNDGYVRNVLTESHPAVLHGNGPIKNDFNTLTNYLNKNWSPDEGCQQCSRDTIDLSTIQNDFNTLTNYLNKNWSPDKGCQQCSRDTKSTIQSGDYPLVTMTVFIEYATPFIDEFFDRLTQLDYPKSKIDVCVHYSTDFHKSRVQDFRSQYLDLYRSLVVFGPTDFKSEHYARNSAIKLAIDKGGDFLFVVDSSVQITNPKTLRHLVSQNRSILAPMVTRRGKLWSNFWGALSKNGYYARSDDYMDLVNRNKLGVWVVPHISQIYLIQKKWLLELKDVYVDTSGNDPEMAFSRNVRSKTIFMYMTNQEYFGHLILYEKTETNRVHTELYEIFQNPLDWAERYIHPNFSSIINSDDILHSVEQPCPDVFWFPLLSPLATKHLIEEVENFGEWSNVTNSDPGLEGGYKNVSTRDIHMRQIGWEEHWQEVLREYIYPMQRALFQGINEKPWARMNFIVRYRPDEQANLRPHNDSSSYILNIALNEAGKDYEGGRRPICAI